MLVRNSSEVITSITTQIIKINALNALLQLFLLVAVFLLFGLLMINAPVALAAAAFGTVYTY